MIENAIKVSNIWPWDGKIILRGSDLIRWALKKGPDTSSRCSPWEAFDLGELLSCWLWVSRVDRQYGECGKKCCWPVVAESGVWLIAGKEMGHLSPITTRNWILPQPFVLRRSALGPDENGARLTELGANKLVLFYTTMFMVIYYSNSRKLIQWEISFKLNLKKHLNFTKCHAACFLKESACE